MPKKSDLEYLESPLKVSDEDFLDSPLTSTEIPPEPSKEPSVPLGEVGRFIGKAGLGIGKSLLQPEVSVPMAASVAGGIIGGPVGAIGASTLSKVALEAEKMIAEKGEKDSEIDRILQTFPGPVALGARIVKSVTPSSEEVNDALRNRMIQSAIPGVYPDVPDVTQIEGVGRLAKAGIKEGIAQTLGEGLTKVFSVFRANKIPKTIFTKERPIMKAEILPGAMSADELIRENGGLGLSLAQMTEGTNFDWSERIGRGGFFKSSILPEADISREKALMKIRTNLSRDFYTNAGRPLTPRELAKLVDEEGINVGRTASRAIENNLYDELDGIAGGQLQWRWETPKPGLKDIVNLNVGQTPQFIDPLSPVLVQHRVGGARVSLAPVKETMEGLVKAAKTDRALNLIKGITQEEESISWLQAKQLRSDLLDLSRDATDPTLQKVASTLGTSLDGQMETSARSLGKDFYRKWRKANKFFKENKRDFENDFMARIFVEKKEAPSLIGRKIYWEGTPEDIESVLRGAKRSEKLAKYAEYKGLVRKQRIGGEIREVPITKATSFNEIQKGLKSGFWEELVQSASTRNETKSVGWDIDFDQILNRLDDPKVKESMAVLFTPQERFQMLQWAKAGQLAITKSPGGSSGALQLMQAGAVSAITIRQAQNPNLRNLPAASTAAALILGLPSIISRMALNPNVRKWATQGFKEIGSKAARISATTMSTGIRLIEEMFNNDPTVMDWLTGNIQPKETTQ